MKPLSEIRRSIERLGFDISNGNYKVTSLLYLLLLICLIVNCGFFVVCHWDTLDKRVEGIKGLLLYCKSTMYFMAYFGAWDRSMLMTKTLHEDLHKFAYRPSTERLHLERSIRQGMEKLNATWHYGSLAYITIEITVTLAQLVVKLVQGTIYNAQIETLYLPEPFYFPQNYKTFPVFVFSVIVETVFLFLARLNVYAILASAFMSLQLVEGELKLLRLAVEEMNCFIKNESIIANDYNLYTLKRYEIHLVNYHQDTCRKAKNVTKGIPLIAISTNSCMSIQLCVGIYNMVQRDRIMAYIPDACYCLLILFILYCCNVMGENITTADENLRKSLYGCSWTDKPNWFKKSLQIVMARSNKPIEITSVGLFSLNLKTFSMTIRAAYSFYNLLNNFKK